MTTTDLDRLAQPRTTANGSQATIVEQSRAVAEVAAAVRVAQDNPRDMNRARGQMRQACSTMALAQKAFYSVPNRGNDASVHLARELARCWGNVQIGVKELSRDDEAGQSEVLAFAWDVENNARSERSFVVPHARMKGRERQKLIDLTDIVNNNNNVGARALRETIWHVLPTWFREEAKGLCRETLERGDGVPLPDRIDKMLAAFRRINVDATQLEKRAGRKQAAWDAQDVADLGVVFQSIKAGESSVAEEFPDDKPAGVTTEEITAEDAFDNPATPEPTDA